jgi:hypothetical protein
MQPAHDVGPALDRLFTKSGAYVIPDPRSDDATLTERLDAGPFATVHIRKGGTPAMDPTVLLKGFGLEFLSCLLMVLLLGRAGIPGYTGRVIFILLVGCLIAFYSQGSLVIWWHQDMGWHTRTLIHDVIGWALAGVILGGFTKPGS